MADFKQIAGYMDQLHQDIGQLVILIENLMGENSYIALPSSGNRASYRVTTHLAHTEGWRVPYITRCFVPEIEEDAFTESLLFVIVLDTNTVFDFPSLICARAFHPSVTENAIYNRIYLPDYFKTLVSSRPSWRYLRQEEGWYVVEPAFRTLTTAVRAYVLNLFEINNHQKVVDNIITPLIEGSALAEMLTIPTYPIFEDLP